MSHFDVVVVGGGPAGAAAAFCARRGLRVALFEHKKFPRHKVCGDVINPNCWPLLQRLGVAGNIRALPHHKITGALITAPGGARVDVSLNGGSMIAVRRSLFDACLLDHARSCGVSVFEGETVHDITPCREVLTRSGRYLALEGIIGADGRHSVVAKRAGLARPAIRNGHVAFQAHYRAPAAMDDRVQLHLFPGGYCGAVRIDEQRVNLCIVTTRQGARAQADPEELFARSVWQNPQFRALGIAPEPLEPMRSAHPLWAPMNRPAGDGVFLVGDALKTVEPFTGQGIFFALRTAELAADAICGGGAAGGYAHAVAGLYRRRTRSNELLRRLLYRPGAAGVLMRIVRQWPGVLRWLAGNVLSESELAGPDAAGRIAPR
jgi:flavin-dependent dehydrogenase